MSCAAAVVTPPAGAGRAALLAAVTLLLHAGVVVALRERLVEPVGGVARPPHTIDVALIPETLRATPSPRARGGVERKATVPRPAAAKPATPGPRAVVPVTPQAPASAASQPAAAVAADTAVAEQLSAATLAANLAMELGELGGAAAAFPASGRYVYGMHDSRYAESGSTTIDWRVDPATHRYEARLESTLAGSAVASLASVGSIQRFGLAPERYVQSTEGRSPQAANVDWERRTVTFSAHGHERPAREGLQDQLSFRFQLMALGQQLPAAFRPGAIVVMEIVGPGDVDVYRFMVVGLEVLATEAGPVETVKLDRPRERAGESRVEAWLAPARRYLPVRLRLTDPRGNVTESLLESVREVQ